MIFDLIIEIKEIHIDKPVITVQDFLNVDNKLADNLSGIFSVGHNIYLPFAPENRLFFLGTLNVPFHVGPFINESIKSQITEYKYFASKNYWYEIDTLNDLMCLKKDITKLF